VFVKKNLTIANLTKNSLTHKKNHLKKWFFI
jgi:hypothetical protein